MTSDDIQRMRAIVEARPAAFETGPEANSDRIRWIHKADTALIACLDEIERLRTAIFELADWYDGRQEPQSTVRVCKLLGPNGVAQWQAWREKAGRG